MLLIFNIVYSLIKTNKKNDKTLIKWIDDARVAFEELKHALINVSLLAYPTESSNIVLCTDAFDFAIGGVEELSNCYPFIREN